MNVSEAVLEWVKVASEASWCWKDSLFVLGILAMVVSVCYAGSVVAWVRGTCVVATAVVVRPVGWWTSWRRWFAMTKVEKSLARAWIDIRRLSWFETLGLVAMIGAMTSAVRRVWKARSNPLLDELDEKNEAWVIPQIVRSKGPDVRGFLAEGILASAGAILFVVGSPASMMRNVHNLRQQIKGVLQAAHFVSWVTRFCGGGRLGHLDEAVDDVRCELEFGPENRPSEEEREALERYKAKAEYASKMAKKTGNPRNWRKIPNCSDRLKENAAALGVNKCWYQRARSEDFVDDVDLSIFDDESVVTKLTSFMKKHKYVLAALCAIALVGAMLFVNSRREEERVEAKKDEKKRYVLLYYSRGCWMVAVKTDKYNEVYPFLPGMEGQFTYVQQKGDPTLPCEVTYTIKMTKSVKSDPKTEALYRIRKSRKGWNAYDSFGNMMDARDVPVNSKVTMSYSSDEDDLYDFVDWARNTGLAAARGWELSDEDEWRTDLGTNATAAYDDVPSSLDRGADRFKYGRGENEAWLADKVSEILAKLTGNINYKKSEVVPPVEKTSMLSPAPLPQHAVRFVVENSDETVYARIKALVSGSSKDVVKGADDSVKKFTEPSTSSAADSVTASPAKATEATPKKPDVCGKCGGLHKGVRCAVDCMFCRKPHEKGTVCLKFKDVVCTACGLKGHYASFKDVCKGAMKKPLQTEGKNEMLGAFKTVKAEMLKQWLVTAVFKGSGTQSVHGSFYKGVFHFPKHVTAWKATVTESARECVEVLITNENMPTKVFHVEMKDCKPVGKRDCLAVTGLGVEVGGVGATLGTPRDGMAVCLYNPTTKEFSCGVITSCDGGVIHYTCPTDDGWCGLNLYDQLGRSLSYHTIGRCGGDVPDNSGEVMDAEWASLITGLPKN